MKKFTNSFQFLVGLFEKTNSVINAIPHDYQWNVRSAINITAMNNVKVLTS